MSPEDAPVNSNINRDGTSRSEPTISSIGSPVNPMRLGERGHKMILTAAVATRPGVAAAAVR